MGKSCFLMVFHFLTHGTCIHIPSDHPHHHTDLEEDAFKNSTHHIQAETLGKEHVIPSKCAHKIPQLYVSPRYHHHQHWSFIRQEFASCVLCRVLMLSFLLLFFSVLCGSLLAPPKHFLSPCCTLPVCCCSFILSDRDR